MGLKALIIILLTITTFYAQNNIESLGYFEAVKIISSHKYNLLDTPFIAFIDKGINLQHEV